MKPKALYTEGSLLHRPAQKKVPKFPVQTSAVAAATTKIAPSTEVSAIALVGGLGLGAQDGI